MSTVALVELFHVAVPLPAPFHPSWIPGFPQIQNRFTLLRVTTDDGVVGLAAGPAMGRERQGLGELLGPYLLGEDATDIPSIQQRLREIGYLGWRNWWVEPAFWDIKGKLAGQPVWRLLRAAQGTEAGPDPCVVELYASTGQVKASAQRIPEVEARLAEGFHSVKLRVHAFDPAEDERQVVETARAVGAGHRVKLGVDANQAWRVAAIADAPLWDLARARRFASVCADAGLSWLEEPLPMDAWDDQATLCAESRIPISGGEIHTGGLAELRMMVARGCYHIFQPDAIFTGGIAQTIEVARLCRAAGRLFTPHTWTNGIGFAVNLPVFAGSGFAGEKALEYPFDPPGWTVEGRDGLLATPWRHDRGRIAAPEAPGLGIELDGRALRRYASRFFVMDRKRLLWWALWDRGPTVAKAIDAARRARRAGLPTA
jgi:L-alanine-DL-glutamate epimerase-like enolase superfamily enzyme